MNIASRLTLLCLSVLPVCTSWAAVYCVTSESEFRAALNAVGSTFSTDSNEIKLTQRVFFNGSQVFSTQVSSHSGNLLISGGWDGGAFTACDGQAVDARLTVLDAQGASAVLSIERNGASAGLTPSITVSNLTLRNGVTAAAPGGAYISNYNGSVYMDDVIVHGNRATASPYYGGVALTLDSSANDIQLRNALIYNNQGVFTSGAALPNVLFTSISLNANRNWYATNNTIVAGPNLAADAIRMQSDGNFWLINNVLRGTVTYGTSVTGAGGATAPQLRQLFNNFSALPNTANTVVVSNLSNSTANPLIDATTFAPLAGSPLIDGGLGSPPGGLPTLGFPPRDVRGGVRVVNSVPDIGAVESQTVPPPLPTCTLDVDGNGTRDALTDGLIMLRALLGLTGTTVTNGALGANATRGDWASIRAFLNGSCGGTFAP